GDDAAFERYEAVRKASERFFADVAAWKEGHQGGTGRVREPGIVGDCLSGELSGLAEELERLAKGTPSEEEQIEFVAVAQRLGGPFDFHEQAELHLFRRMPDPSAQPVAFEDAVIARIPEYVARTQGRAFVLFTSYQFMQKAAAKLRGELAYRGLTLLCQGEGL